MKSQTTLVFLHGLNTFGDDDIHIGPLKFGAMHSRLFAGLTARGLRCETVPRLGHGSIESQLAIAHQYMDQIDLPDSFHLLGQSTGGLVARALAASPKYRARVSTVMTLGTPNQGTWAAEFALSIAKRHRALHRVFKIFGYDSNEKTEIFRHFTPGAVGELNRWLRPQALEEQTPRTHEISLLCEVSQLDLAWPLVPLYRLLHPNGEPSDGFVWTQSQRHGRTIGPFALDHFGELGFFPHLSQRARTRAKSEFERLLDQIAAIVSPPSQNESQR